MQSKYILSLLDKLEIDMPDFIPYGGVFNCKDLFLAFNLIPIMSDKIKISGEVTKFINCKVDTKAVKPLANGKCSETFLSSDHIDEIARIFNQNMWCIELSMRHLFYLILRLTLVVKQSEVKNLISKYEKISLRSGSTNHSIILKMLKAIEYNPTGKLVSYDESARPYLACKRTYSNKFVSGNLLPAAWRSQITASLISAARKEVAKCYEGGENEGIVYISFYYLTERIRCAWPDEDARKIISTFKNVMMQGEFFSNDQTFLTARNNSKS